MEGYYNPDVYTPVDARSCPFCGGKTVLVVSKDFYNGLCEEHGSAMLDISCAESLATSCRATHPASRFPTTSW